MFNEYKGSFNDQDWYQVYLNGKLFDHTPSLKIRNHSPDGFAWGYGGSGPSQLALAILLKETDKQTAEQYYMDFKWKVIANLPQEGWFFTSVEVDQWLLELKTKSIVIDSSVWKYRIGRYTTLIYVPNGDIIHAENSLIKGVDEWDVEHFISEDEIIDYIKNSIYQKL